MRFFIGLNPMHLESFTLNFPNRQSIDRSFFEACSEEPHFIVPSFSFDGNYTTRDFVALLDNLNSIFLRYLESLFLCDFKSIPYHANRPYVLFFSNLEPLHYLLPRHVVADYLPAIQNYQGLLWSDSHHVYGAATKNLVLSQVMGLLDRVWERRPRE